jgi:hypothetical protein
MDETEIITSKIKGNLIPALILIAVVIFFIILFILVAFYWQRQSIPVENSELTENSKRCIELGCPENSIYVGSINSDKYYECECHYADSIKLENLICFSSESEAESTGRTKSEC